MSGMGDKKDSSIDRIMEALDYFRATHEVVTADPQHDIEPGTWGGKELPETAPEEENKKRRLETLGVVLDRTEKKLPLERYKGFYKKLMPHLEMLCEVYSYNVIGYGIETSRKKPDKKNVKRQRKDIDEHFKCLDETVRSEFPLESNFEFQALIDLNEALVRNAVELGNLTDEENRFLTKYIDHFRFSIPFDIKKRGEHGRHKGEVTGYYDITLYIPLPDGNEDGLSYKEVKTFVKVFKDIGAKDSEEFHAKVGERKNCDYSRVLHSHVGEYGILILQYRKDSRLKRRFGRQLKVQLDR